MHILSNNIVTTKCYAIETAGRRGNGDNGESHTSGPDFTWLCERKHGQVMFERGNKVDGRSVVSIMHYSRHALISGWIGPFPSPIQCYRLYGHVFNAVTDTNLSHGHAHIFFHVSMSRGLGHARNLRFALLYVKMF